ncbi:acyltransferase, partial [Staphylococcus aureus]|nr:acyltransferase [Staphylococcus aureus]
GIVIGILRGFAIYPFKDTVSIFTYLFLIVTSLIIVFVLSSRFVCKWTNPVINLRKPADFKD